MSVQRRLKAALFCLILPGPGLFSQIILEGVVTDTGSEPVQNALIELTDQSDASRKFSGYTNEQGQYSIEIDVTGIDDSDSRNAGDFRLLQNYPNPFNPSTVIAWELSRPGQIRIEIHNILGQKVRTLFDGFQSRLAGQMIWDGTDDLHQGVPAGVYI